MRMGNSNIGPMRFLGQGKNVDKELQKMKETIEPYIEPSYRGETDSSGENESSSQHGKVHKKKSKSRNKNHEPSVKQKQIENENGKQRETGKEKKRKRISLNVTRNNNEMSDMFKTMGLRVNSEDTPTKNCRIDYSKNSSIEVIEQLNIRDGVIIQETLVMMDDISYSLNTEIEQALNNLEKIRNQVELFIKSQERTFKEDSYLIEELDTSVDNRDDGKQDIEAVKMESEGGDEEQKEFVALMLFFFKFFSSLELICKSVEGLTKIRTGTELSFNLYRYTMVCTNFLRNEQKVANYYSSISKKLRVIRDLPLYYARYNFANQDSLYLLWKQNYKGKQKISSINKNTTSLIIEKTDEVGVPVIYEMVPNNDRILSHISLEVFYSDCMPYIKECLKKFTSLFLEKIESSYQLSNLSNTFIYMKYICKLLFDYILGNDSRNLLTISYTITDWSPLSVFLEFLKYYIVSNRHKTSMEFLERWHRELSQNVSPSLKDMVIFEIIKSKLEYLFRDISPPPDDNDNYSDDVMNTTKEKPFQNEAPFKKPFPPNTPFNIANPLLHTRFYDSEYKILLRDVSLILSTFKLSPNNSDILGVTENSNNNKDVCFSFIPVHYNFKTAKSYQGNHN